MTAEEMPETALGVEQTLTINGTWLDIRRPNAGDGRDVVVLVKVDDTWQETIRVPLHELVRLAFLDESTS